MCVNVSNFSLELRTALYMENLFILHKALLRPIAKMRLEWNV